MFGTIIFFKAHVFSIDFHYINKKLRLFACLKKNVDIRAWDHAWAFSQRDFHTFPPSLPLLDRKIPLKKIKIPLRRSSRNPEHQIHTFFDSNSTIYPRCVHGSLSSKFQINPQLSWIPQIFGMISKSIFLNGANQ